MQPPLLVFPIHPHPVWQPEHRLHERLPRLARRLRIAGVAEVRVEYEGHWGFAHVDLVLEARYPKWADAALTHEHNTRYIAFNTEIHEGL